jgi:hypothetical protein
MPLNRLTRLAAIACAGLLPSAHAQDAVVDNRVVPQKDRSPITHPAIDANPSHHSRHLKGPP